MKKLLFMLLMCLSLLSFGDSNLDYAKQEYKLRFISLRQKPQGIPLVAIADRLEADALLELASEPYINYSNYNQAERWDLIDMDEVIMIMPRIDLLEKHLKALAGKTKVLHLFVMEGDKLDGVYGDRSFETFEKSKIFKNLPANVEMHKLKNQSVTPSGFKNNYEFGEIQNSLVFRNQILRLYSEKSNYKIFDLINEKAK